MDALESFRVFAETLNFTHAAERRHLTQPALHKQVRNLSSDLGTILYGKNGRELYLTEAGIEVARFARETHEQITLLRSQLSGNSERLPITLSAGRGSYLYLLGPAIRFFQTRNPGVLRIQVNDSDGTLKAVRSGRAHLGVTVLQEPPPDLTVTAIQQVTPQLIVSDTHPLSGRKTVSTKDLDNLSLITPPAPSPLRDLIGSFLARDKRTFNPIMEAPGWDLAMHLVALGLGATIVNGCCRPPRRTSAIPLKGFPSTIYYLVERQSGLFRSQVEDLKESILNRAETVNLFRS